MTVTTDDTIHGPTGAPSRGSAMTLGRGHGNGDSRRPLKTSERVALDVVHDIVADRIADRRPPAPRGGDGGAVPRQPGVGARGAAPPRGPGPDPAQARARRRARRRQRRARPTSPARPACTSTSGPPTTTSCCGPRRCSSPSAPRSRPSTPTGVRRCSRSWSPAQPRVGRRVPPPREALPRRDLPAGRQPGHLLLTQAITHIVTDHVVATMDPIELRSAIVDEHAALARAIAGGRDRRPPAG